MVSEVRGVDWCLCSVQFHGFYWFLTTASDLFWYIKQYGLKNAWGFHIHEKGDRSLKYINNTGVRNLSKSLH